MIGLTVVGNPAATVITSSPGFNRRSPSLGEVRALTATRLADEPELTRDALRTPTKRASLRSKSSANRPVVNHASSAESTTALTSSPLITFPETGTGDSPGLNSAGELFSRKYCAHRSRICCRSCVALLVIGPQVQNTQRECKRHSILAQ